MWKRALKAEVGARGHQHQIIRTGGKDSTQGKTGESEEEFVSHVEESDAFCAK